MPKAKNAVWRFFASVQLALTTLFVLAVTSVIGTLIQQGKVPSYYVQEYGRNLARLFEILDFTDMYRSWWFIALLSMFAVNLIVCSIERFPGAWRMVFLDNLAIDPERLGKMPLTHKAGIDLPPSIAVDRMRQFLTGAGWKKPRRLDREDGAILLFTQKGAWTRLAVYVVHLSILVILAGGMIGTYFGFKAYVFLPEGRTAKNVFLQKNKEPVPLGFDLRCDHFEKTYYPNGMIKEYRTDLTVLDPERKAPYHKSIIVNDPLAYRGITFYLSDVYPLDEYMVVIRNQKTGMEQAFRVPPKRDVAWQGGGVSFRIDGFKDDPSGAVRRAKIRFTADGAKPSVFWADDLSTVTISQQGEDFSFSFRQLYSTLLLAIKDPGVLIVYLGSFLMIAGLAISFFLSHRRIWVQMTPRDDRGTRILICGASNKHKPAFKRRFQVFADRFGRDFELLN